MSPAARRARWAARNPQLVQIKAKMLQLYHAITALPPDFPVPEVAIEAYIDLSRQFTRFSPGGATLFDDRMEAHLRDHVRKKFPRP